MSSLSMYSRFETLPDYMKQEVADFIDFLLERSATEKRKIVTEKKKIVPQFGSAKGKIKMSDDFDAPLEDFKDYM